MRTEYQQTLINAAREALEEGGDVHDAQAAVMQLTDSDHVAEVYSEAIAADATPFRSLAVQHLLEAPLSDPARMLLAAELSSFVDEAINDMMPADDWRTEAAARDEKQRRDDLKAEIRAAG
jgi:hypothetical protein